LTRGTRALKLKDWALAIARRSTMRKARLVHVRDGSPVPDNLAELAGEAIHAFAQNE
jgi:hypothetical protein